MFYDNLKSLCDSKGIKITTVVTKCGGALGSISKWKKGASPNSDIVIKLSSYLGVTTDYLLKGEEQHSIFNVNNDNKYGGNANNAIGNGINQTNFNVSGKPLSSNTNVSEIVQELNEMLCSLDDDNQREMLTEQVHGIIDAFKKFNKLLGTQKKN
ncbi:MAG: helix-turn-helix domain-containing protein [Oscillospiraceae bacterium]|nr:helix-turn-helix domain-containing protein [Oscillospiraceae bacterium]